MERWGGGRNRNWRTQAALGRLSGRLLQQLGPRPTIDLMGHVIHGTRCRKSSREWNMMPLLSREAKCFLGHSAWLVVGLGTVMCGAHDAHGVKIEFGAGAQKP